MRRTLICLLIVAELAAATWLVSAHPIDGWIVNAVCATPATTPTPAPWFTPRAPYYSNPEPFRLDILNG